MFNVAPTIFIGAEHGIGRILEENGCGFASASHKRFTGNEEAPPKV